MQKTIFALCGPSDSGKTTTISLVYHDLKQQEGTTVIYAGRPARKEIRGAVLEINGVRAGFASFGDIAEDLETLLCDLIERDCIIIVCATHTARSKTAEVVRAKERQQGFRIEWIEQARDSDHNKANRKKADEIIKKVLKAVEDVRLEN